MFRSSAIAFCAAAVVACWGPAAEQDAKPAGGHPIYGLCMEMHDAKQRSMEEQAVMLHELGFDGAGYPLWMDENLEKNLAVLDKEGLKVFLLYATINLDQSPAFDPRLPDAMRKLRGRPVTICVLLRGFPPGDERGMEPAVKVLRSLGDLARENGLRISIYHHTGDWTDSILFALKVVKQVDHAQVGVNFNLCHWLMVDGGKDYEPVLRDNVAKVFAVTINGAQVGTKTWTDGLIQPLDKGDFDNQRLLKFLDGVGYRGPIGIMCYGIPGDAREHLERSVRVWRSWKE